MFFAAFTRGCILDVYIGGRTQGTRFSFRVFSCCIELIFVPAQKILIVSVAHGGVGACFLNGILDRTHVPSILHEEAES